MTDFYLLDEKLTDDERGVRDRLRDFCAKEVTPVINGYWERAEFPFELVPKIAQLQMAGGTVEGDAVELHPVIYEPGAELLGDPLLEKLELVIDEFDDGAVRFRHQVDARRYAEHFGLAVPVMSPPVAPTP